MPRRRGLGLPLTVLFLFATGLFPAPALAQEQETFRVQANEAVGAFPDLVTFYLTATVPGAQSGVLWWALAMGACLGGNGTLIGASANVVTAGMAEKAGYRITFAQYLRICLPPMILSIVVCTIWLLAMEI